MNRLRPDWQYQADGSCIQMKSYLFGWKRSRTEHIWTEWKPGVAGSCKEMRSCMRCNEKQSREQHVWASWKFDKFTSSRECCRCGAIENCTDHSWTGWEWAMWDYDHDWFERHCTVCGLAEHADYGTG
jgi:hypothetical protein